MSKYNLDAYYTIFQKVLYMSEERYREYKSELNKKSVGGDGIVHHIMSDIGNVDDLAMKGKEKELFTYLNSLDYEVVKTLQVIMYIGRDSSCIESDGTYSYEKTRERFDRQGWNDDKSIEVHQMVEKVPLHEYLKNGFDKLKIVL